jgi:hypothetical protein
MKILVTKFPASISNNIPRDNIPRGGGDDDGETLGASHPAGQGDDDSGGGDSAASQHANFQGGRGAAAWSLYG